ncbi:MAG: protein kinase [Planctomycetaceae bacterium]|nr:protein kinase [Planctomycetaceae bacterium]
MGSSKRDVYLSETQAVDSQEQSDEKLALLLTDLADRAQRGEQVDIVKVCEQYPEHAAELKYLWGTVLVTEAVGINQAKSGSFFGSDSGTWPPQLPYSIGDYELLEQVGQGGMGIVFRARQVNLGREVAIKMIQQDRLNSPEDHQRFLAEAEATARLEHTGIVQVYEVGEFDGTPFFSMQFIRGETLAQRLRSGPMGQRQAAALIASVAKAIDYAHKQGILHRDIKPSNILLDEHGSAKVTDFGLAKFFHANEHLTRTGAILGTPSYMSPEQASGRSNQLGPASDVYSLGTVLYHALTGRPPLVADSPLELALKILEQEPIPPRVLEPKIDRDLEMVVIRCLQKPPDLRYSSAGELAADLEAFLRDEPVMARSGRFTQVLARVLRETHHAAVLENWGLLWMWHSLVLLVWCLLTEALDWAGVENRLAYGGLWTIGLGAWAAVFWAIRHRMGPVTFVERQIAHLWGASMIAIAMLYPFEWWLNLKPLTLSPLLGVVSSMVFLVKAAMLSGVFYVQAAVLLGTSVLMAVFPDYAHLIFGIIAGLCFFVPGLKYHRQRQMSLK